MPFETAGPVTIEGRPLAELNTFGFGANELASAATYTFANGAPRFVLPDAATTDVYLVKHFPNEWLSAGLGVKILIDWTNDHSATGNVRWQFEFRKNDVGGLLSTATVVHTSTVTVAAPSANGGLATTTVVDNLNVGTFVFGSRYALRVTRLGSDGADTLAGPVGLMGVDIHRTTAA